MRERDTLIIFTALNFRYVFYFAKEVGLGWPGFVRKGPVFRFLFFRLDIDRVRFSYGTYQVGLPHFTALVEVTVLPNALPLTPSS